ncbi:MAG: hypothetical protein AMDU2_EPLC00005G0373 [Thermoplasmatales archaeon E-plasma]|jgi:AbrB family looped-hinge helix DNA binding protein|nr:MAG: hypothetical protein AMDU2_EPLC00005G0373 [Thermoplasmatales archaeon E-plasma]
MIQTIIKMGIAGRGQIPQDIRKKLNIHEGDRLIVDIREVLKGDEEESADHQTKTHKQEVEA